MKLQEFEKIAKMLAKEHKISVESGMAWCANIKGRKVFYKKEDIYNLTEDHILGLLLHEIAHIHYTKDVEMPTLNPELTHSTLNMIEDISIEYIIGSDYPNAEEILESTKSEVLDTLLKILPKLHISPHEKSLLFAATRFEGRGYQYGTEPYEKLGEKISEIMLKRKNEILERKETKDLMPMTNEIVELIIKTVGEPTDQQKAQMRQNLQEGQSGNQMQQGTVKRKTINALRTQKGWKEGIEICHSVAYIDAIGDQAAMIGKKLRTVLKRNNAMEFAGRFRSGKLLAKRFIRVKVLKDRKPFARRIVKSNQSYAFALASDVSGSMFNSSIAGENEGSYALSSMYMVGEALRMAGIPRSMTIFGYNANTVSPMTKLPIPFEQLGNEKSMRKANQSGTEIGKAMNNCIKELSKVRAERKIMIILTDGESDLEGMQEAHKKALQADIEPLGITIGRSGSYMDKTFGKNKNTKIEDTNNKSLIGTAFINILKESIKKST